MSLMINGFLKSGLSLPYFNNASEQEILGNLSVTIFLLENYSSMSHINVGTGKEISIFDFANLIKKIVGFEGNIILDKTKPDGTYLKRLDTSKINGMGWFANIELEKGLKMTYTWALKNKIFENEN